MKTKEEVLELISGVMHPAINYSLRDLEIVRDLNVNENSVEVIFAFPFPGIPIADALVNSISKPIVTEGMGFKYKIDIMNTEEKDKFMKMEMAGWVG